MTQYLCSLRLIRLSLVLAELFARCETMDGLKVLIAMIKGAAVTINQETQERTDFVVHSSDARVGGWFAGVRCSC